MRKSAIAMLVISIILLIAGIVLVSYGVYLNMPHSSVYSYGHGYISYSYRAVWTGHGGAGMPFTEFGRLLFDAGLLSMNWRRRRERLTESMPKLRRGMRRMLSSMILQRLQSRIRMLHDVDLSAYMRYSLWESSIQGE